VVQVKEITNARRHIIAGIVTPFITMAAGFLAAVLWFDLMFDVQVRRYRRESTVPQPVLDSIAAYYRRVTTTASPMGRLVAVVMLVLLAGLIVQAANGDVEVWVSVVSLLAAGLAIGLAVLRIFGRARRLGEQKDPQEVQVDLARSIFREHIVCLLGITTVLVIQLSAA
jgi:hypothetical protein